MVRSGWFTMVGALLLGGCLPSTPQTTCLENADCPTGYFCEPTQKLCQRAADASTVDAAVVDGTGIDLTIRDARVRDATRDAVVERPGLDQPVDGGAVDSAALDSGMRDQPAFERPAPDHVAGDGNTGDNMVFDRASPDRMSAQDVAAGRDVAPRRDAAIRRDVATTADACVPACADRCGGVHDGCGGTCDGPCPADEWCSTDVCSPCGATDDLHCGQRCLDCTAAPNNGVCIDGACGCTTAAHCGPGAWCNTGSCESCNSGAHCGVSCVDCTSPLPNADGRACVSGQCGCDNDSDCDYGVYCGTGLCAEIGPAIGAWYSTDICTRIDVQYPDMYYGAEHWAWIRVFNATTNAYIGFMSSYHQAVASCDLYFPGNTTWPHSYYRFHGTPAEFRLRGLPQFVKFRFLDASGVAYSGFSDDVDLGP